MVWEHKHIANAKLEAAFPGQKVTLRQLLQLDKLKDVPETWPSGNYDYFWIVDFADGSDTPTGFTMVKQEFARAYDKLPTNDWDAPNGLKSASGCDLEGRGVRSRLTPRLRSISSLAPSPSSPRHRREAMAPAPSGLSAKKRSWNTTRLERWPIETIAAFGSRSSSSR